MNSEQNTQTRLVDAINGGEDLAGLLNSLFLRRHQFPQLIGAAVSMLAHCFIAARDGGSVVTQSDTSMGVFLSGNLTRLLFDLNLSVNGDGDLASRQISSMVSAINSARETRTTWIISPQPEVSPVPVAVVSMVNRETKTEVLRDGKTHAIIGSTQREFDSQFGLAKDN